MLTTTKEVIERFNEARSSVPPGLLSDSSVELHFAAYIPKIIADIFEAAMPIISRLFPAEFPTMAFTSGMMLALENPELAKHLVETTPSLRDHATEKLIVTVITEFNEAIKNGEVS